MPAQVCALYQTGDSHIAVYDFDRATMLVSFPSPSGFPTTGAAVVKAYDRPFTGNSPLRSLHEPFSPKSLAQTVWRWHTHQCSI
eukprot:COSAG04_NODE_130_length_24323_cov_50.932835_36_plen_84_part_00